MFLRYVCRVFYTVFMLAFVLLLIVRLLVVLMQVIYGYEDAPACDGGVSMTQCLQEGPCGSRSGVRASLSFSVSELFKFGLPSSFTYEFGTFGQESMRIRTSQGSFRGRRIDYFTYFQPVSTSSK